MTGAEAVDPPGVPTIRPDSITNGYWEWRAEQGWRLRQPYDDPMTPLFDEIWEQCVGRHFDADGDGIADQVGEAASDVEVLRAMGATGYSYSDPDADDAFPRIGPHDSDEAPDAFPPGWGQEPTARDQAAIDAGNA